MKRCGVRSKPQCYNMDAQFAEGYEQLYQRHWWFRARERILVGTIRELGLPRNAEILDVGCGNGLLFEELQRFGTVRGIEVDRSLIPSDSRHRDRICEKPLGDPYYSTCRFDLITALDVIEHIEDDSQALDDMLVMLRPGGRLIITVPAFMMLWDRHDEINRHYRRYTRRSLRTLIANRGSVRRLSYLFHLLVVPKLAVGILNRACGAGVPQHVVPARWINKCMEVICLSEYQALRSLGIPFGTSLLAVLEKRKN
jgi:2-polyprenyl-3-methyl-5-hydroxy-6-metoxy-1,4-benzoquinol methylase